MLKLLLKMLLLPPDLLQAHAKGYADLASELGARYLCALQSRWLMYGVSALMLTLALVLGGTAVLIWSALPLTDAPHAWVLVALPLTCLLVSGVCWVRARRLCLHPVWQDLQAQIQLDILALQQGHSA